MGNLVLIATMALHKELALFFLCSTTIIHADKYHPHSEVSLKANEDQFAEPVCDSTTDGSVCTPPLTPMDPKTKQIRHWAKEEETTQFWTDKTMAEVRQAESIEHVKGKAKYSII